MIHEEVLEKFGYPNTLIKEYDYWYWLLRPEQVTLGSSILITKEYYSKYSDLTREHFLEFEKIIKEVEKTLGKAFNYDKMNYLMLMMVDPSVHYHAIPRYAEPIVLNETQYFDKGYPGLPDLSSINTASNTDIVSLLSEMVN